MDFGDFPGHDNCYHSDQLEKGTAVGSMRATQSRRAVNARLFCIIFTLLS